VEGERIKSQFTEKETEKGREAITKGRRNSLRIKKLWGLENRKRWRTLSEDDAWSWDDNRGGEHRGGQGCKERPISRGKFT